MSVPTARVVRAGTLALAAIPVLCLAAMSVTWLHYGMDLPVWDDWRAYETGQGGSFDVAYLFRPSNDTIYAVGKLLDSLAQRLLNGNSVAYQLVSMIAVLGGFLVLQWKLLDLSLNDRVLSGFCLVSTMFMLQPGTYWGRQNLAYHQALPLLLLLLCLLIILKATWPRIWKALAIFALGMTAGLSYISGAIASIAMAMSLLILCIGYRDFRDRALGSSIGLLLSGVSTSTAQLWLFHAKGGFDRTAGQLTSPLDPSFWFYLLGKVGRAFQLPPSTPGLSLAISLLLVAGCCGLAARIALAAARARRTNSKINDLDVVFLSIAGVVFVYLLMVATARTGFRANTASPPLVAFRSGFGRFHFFWVTIILPWILAYIFIKMKDRLGVKQLYITCFAIIMSISLFNVLRGGLDYGSYFQLNTNRLRVAASTCMLETLAQGSSARCEAIPEKFDWPRGYAYAVTIGASFTRGLPSRLLLSRSDEAAPWTDVMRDESAQMEFVNATASAQGDRTIRVTAAASPQIVFSAGTDEQWRTCTVMELQADLEPSKTGTVRLFFTTNRNSEFSTARMVKDDIQYAGDGITIIASSYAGFASRFRLDLETPSRDFDMGSLRVRCLLSSLR